MLPKDKKFVLRMCYLSKKSAFQVLQEIAILLGYSSVSEFQSSFIYKTGFTHLHNQIYEYFSAPVRKEDYKNVSKFHPRYIQGDLFNE